MSRLSMPLICAGLWAAAYAYEPYSPCSSRSKATNTSVASNWYCDRTRANSITAAVPLALSSAPGLFTES